MPEKPDEPRVARRGKIASLPRVIRMEINRRLDDGEQGPQIVAWLNGDKTVFKVLERLWSGYAITEQNLSEWRQSGYEDWLQRQEEFEMLRELSEHALKMGESVGGNITEGSAAIAGSKILAALGTASHEDAVKLVDAIHRLRTGDIGRVRLDLRRRYLAQRDEMIELNRNRYQRETMALFIKWHENKEARRILESDGDNSEKLERLGRAIFGEDWDTAPAQSAGTADKGTQGPETNRT